MVSASTLLRNAIVDILSADEAVQQLTGKTKATGAVVSWNLPASFRPPVIAYLLPTNDEIGGLAGSRHCLALFGAMADGAQGLTVAEALIQRVREALTATALAAKGVDAAVLRVTERTIDPDNGLPAGRARVDAEVLIRLAA